MVDLHAVAQQIRLDLLAADCSRTLAAAGVPHALLKGPSTARWLYDPPRAYRDVDLLVPASRLRDAESALAAAGVARSQAGRPGEEAGHSWLLLSPAGAEVDLHVTLPALNPSHAGDPDALWRVVSGHLVVVDLEGTAVPALDPPGRTVVLAMHVVASGHGDERVREDLRRALDRLGAGGQEAMTALATELGIGRHVRAAVSFVRGEDWEAGAPGEVRLRLRGAAASVIQLQVLAGLPPGRRLRFLLREAFPSNGFIRRMEPGAEAASPATLLLLRARRLGRIARSLPAALRRRGG